MMVFPDAPEAQAAFLSAFIHEELVERRRKRRWAIFFKSIFWGYLLVLLYLFWPSHKLENAVASVSSAPFSAVIEVMGEIADDKPASSENIITALDSAFKDKETKGIILRINSPGGSAVQASDIYNAIMAKRKMHPDVKVYAVIEDMGASAAYFIASAADAIYANPASLVGSIGVLIDGFGVPDLMTKLGVERRLITAGRHKGFLDPFSVENPEEKVIAEAMIEEIHQYFIDSVKKGRGDRLKKDPTLFSGLVWNGFQAKKLGLIDDFADIRKVAHDVIGAGELVTFGSERDIIDEVAHKFGLQFGQGTAAALRSTLVSSGVK